VAFVGLSYSFEQLYQSLRRVYRFGQLREVNAYIVQAETEGAIMVSIQRKINQHAEMLKSMKKAAQSLLTPEKVVDLKTDIDSKEGEDWKMYHGDCVRVCATMPDASVDLSVFSPPFASLFTYSADVQDMGNCANKDEFAKQFRFLIKELHRLTKPGRMACVHCCDLLSTKWKDGKIEFQDFSGDIVRGFREEGWKFHSRVTIWKDPVTEMQRTKAHGLLYKTLCADSTDSRMGSPDYLLVFRKEGENAFPVKQRPADFPLERWQEWASPVWMSIDQGHVINGVVEDERSERHICPLQFDIIERAVYMWSKQGDLVFSPFAGVGSEGVQSLKMGRKFIGAELKKSYYAQACEFLANATAQKELELA
jgi:DNA modification methylase